jgi:hypothetical protein
VKQMKARVVRQLCAGLPQRTRREGLQGAGGGSGPTQREAEEKSSSKCGFDVKGVGSVPTHPSAKLATRQSLGHLTDQRVQEFTQGPQNHDSKDCESRRLDASGRLGEGGRHWKCGQPLRLAITEFR